MIAEMYASADVFDVAKVPYAADVFDASEAYLAELIVQLTE